MTYDPLAAFTLVDVVDELTVADEAWDAGVQLVRAGDTASANVLLEKSHRHAKRALKIGAVMCVRDATPAPTPVEPEDADAISRAKWRPLEVGLADWGGYRMVPFVGGPCAGHQMPAAAPAQVWVARSPAGQPVVQYCANGRMPDAPSGGGFVGWYQLNSDETSLTWSSLDLVQS